MAKSVRKSKIQKRSREPGEFVYRFVAASGEWYEEVRHYYRNKDGKRKKKVRVRHLVNGELVYNLDGFPHRPLYRRDDIINAPPGATIYIVEGPHVAEALIADCGVIATTNPFGAGKWPKLSPGEAELLHGHHLVILDDNDGDGMEHADEIAHRQYRGARSIKVLTLSAKRGGDYIDWIDEEGGSPEKLRRLVYEEPEWKPTRKIEISPDPDKEFQAAVDKLRELGCEPAITDAESGQGYSRCPCTENHRHGDSNPSLSFCRGTKGRGFLARCHKGCTWLEINARMRGLPAIPPLPPDYGVRLNPADEQMWLAAAAMPVKESEINRCLFDLCHAMKATFNLEESLVFLGRLLRRW
jgi:hypothetical protein